MYMLYLHISPMFPHKNSGRHIFVVETTYSFTWAYPHVKYKIQSPEEVTGCELSPISVLYMEVGVSFLLHKSAARRKSRLDEEILS